MCHQWPWSSGPSGSQNTRIWSRWRSTFWWYRERKFAKANARTKLEETALNYILKHFRKIISKDASEEFNELSGTELEELIAHDRLNISEENAFKAIVKWIAIKPGSRSQDMGELSCVSLKKELICRLDSVKLTGAKIQFQFQLRYCPNFGLV